ncbi:enterobactin synthase subunit EntD [Enterobacteriaceae bacterium ESL0689]|nr:enterobactin synthase subunit EntD [Enterobacteriaceae bacterium ESL0689]
MDTCHTTLCLAGHSLQRIDFCPATLQASDLLWLPHHRQMTHWGPKRQAEHLAGRIAAAHALQAVGETAIPAIGAQRQPLWPAPWYGSISHCGTCALAVVSRWPSGIDIEHRFSPTLTKDLMESIVNAEEQLSLKRSGLPLEHALTLAFSAKESLFKALPLHQQQKTDFLHLRITDLGAERITLYSAGRTYQVDGMMINDHIITLCTLPACAKG